MPGKPTKSTQKKGTRAGKTTSTASSGLTSERITNLRSTISKELSKQLYQDIEFSFYAPLSHDVRVAGSFTEWEMRAVKLRPSRTGVWKAKIKLKPGRYEYRYLVDGKWENDQEPVELAYNEHGSANCILTVE